MTRLVLENLSKTFPGGVQALRGFSLEIAEGELVAIVGPSGCGKSTLLRVIAGLEEESSGTVRLGARVLNGLPPKDRDIAIVFQSYTLMPHLTVAENLGFGLKLRGEKRNARETKVRGISRLLGIDGLLGRHPAEISGGERQRVALGRAILRQPQIFLFDEPLSSLDAQMRLQLRVEIQRLHQQFPTPMIFVTHDQNEALTLGDRVVVLDQGLIQQAETPDNLYRHPANTFVASFIGSPGMNLFRGHLEATEGAIRFLSPALEFALEPEQAVRLQGRLEVTAGIRPEHFRKFEAGAFLQGQITAVERQAGQTCLFLQNGDVYFAVKTTGETTARAGETMNWNYSNSEIVFFDTKTGLLIPSVK
jgi:multiple sugar transport system ATP-binding protein